MKLKITFIVILVMAVIFTGCGKKNTGSTGNTSTTPSATTTAPTTAAATTAPTSGTTGTATTAPDAVSTASIVNTADAFEKAISSTGTWIIAITKDLTIDKDLVVEGEFKNGKKDDAGKDIIQRKLAFYSQDANRNITARYTLTAPKMTITSPMASIQHGTFKGDLYVSVDNFQLIDATVDGNIYFTTDTAQKTFQMDATSKVTGKQTLKK